MEREITMIFNKCPPKNLNKLKNSLRFEVCHFLNSKINNKICKIRNRDLIFLKHEIYNLNIQEDSKLLFIINKSDDLEKLSSLNNLIILNKYRLKHLKWFIIKINSDFIQLNEFKGILNCINELNDLKMLKFYFPWGNVGREGISLLTSTLSCLKLTYLNLNLKWNLIGDTEIEILSSSFNQSKLYFLKLIISNNVFSSKGLSRLIEAISHQLSLKIFYFDIERIDGGKEAFPKLAECLYKLSKLNDLELILNSMSISTADLTQLMESLSNLKEIKSLRLKLNSNYFSETSINCISKLNKIKNLSQLELGLSRNFINNDGVKFLTESLLNLENLMSLSLDLSRNIFNSLEDLFNQLSKMKKSMSFKINLSSNNFKSFDVENLLNRLGLSRFISHEEIIIINNEIVSILIVEYKKEN